MMHHILFTYYVQDLPNGGSVSYADVTYREIFDENKTYRYKIEDKIFYFQEGMNIADRVKIFSVYPARNVANHYKFHTAIYNRLKFKTKDTIDQRYKPLINKLVALIKECDNTK